MSRHLAQATVANPIDYNRAQIQGLVTLMQSMADTIREFPENFAAIDLAILHENVERFESITFHITRTKENKTA